MKHKGPGKHFVDGDWFESQSADPSLTKKITVESNFRIYFENLQIGKKAYQVNLGIKVGTKRDPVYISNNNKGWVDPKHVIDYGGQDSAQIGMEDSSGAA